MSNLGNFGIPDVSLPIGTATDKDGKKIEVKLASAWFRWITRISQLSAEKPYQVVDPGASPYTYEATTIGHLYIALGTVSGVLLVRGGVNLGILPVPSAAYSPMIPMAAGDTVTITYTVKPIVVFMPGARA